MMLEPVAMATSFLFDCIPLCYIKLCVHSHTNKHAHTTITYAELLKVILEKNL